MFQYEPQPDNFGTDPTDLTEEELRVYVRQLQRVLWYWQQRTARAEGCQSRDEMIAMIARMPMIDTDDRGEG